MNLSHELGQLSPSTWIQFVITSYTSNGKLIYRELVMEIGEGNGTPLQYSCLENPMDGGAWWAAVNGVAKSWTRLSDFTWLFTFMHWRRKWQPTPVFLPGKSQGWGSPVGCRLWGRRVRHDWSDLAAAARAATAAMMYYFCKKILKS